ncbi:unnamed protein product [Ilex paraguariensis]|uniref:CRIB domain-containing protein n=1 Tax=Ilex paraguariensis TaxID=185542 RepID=A0ABC8V342_9AQUA
MHDMSFLMNGCMPTSIGRQTVSKAYTAQLSLILKETYRQRNHLFSFVLCLLLHFLSYPRRGLLDWNCTAFTMATKMKGIYKGFKYISQIFVVKEQEMDIGYPTDVKHVTHIGWDGSSSCAPSWMSKFKAGPDFSINSIPNSGSALSPWSSQDSGESTREQPASDIYKDMRPTNLPPIPKKNKRKKTKATSSPKSSHSSLRSSQAAKLKVKLVEGNAQPANIEVA